MDCHHLFLYFFLYHISLLAPSLCACAPSKPPTHLEEGGAVANAFWMAMARGLCPRCGICVIIGWFVGIYANVGVYTCIGRCASIVNQCKKWKRAEITSKPKWYTVSVCCVNHFPKLKIIIYLQCFMHTYLHMPHVHVRRLPGGKRTWAARHFKTQVAPGRGPTRQPSPSCLRAPPGRFAWELSQWHNMSVHPSLRHLHAAWLSECRSI